MELTPEKPRMFRKLDHLDEVFVRRQPREKHSVPRQNISVFVVELVAMPVPLGNLDLLIGIGSESTWFKDAWIGAQAHCPAVVEIFVAPYDRIALVVKPFPHKVYDRIRSVLVELHAVRLFKPRNVARELNR